MLGRVLLSTVHTSTYTHWHRKFSKKVKLVKVEFKKKIHKVKFEYCSKHIMYSNSNHTKVLVQKGVIIAVLYWVPP
jgi:hypothetical protein